MRDHGIPKAGESPNKAPEAPPSPATPTPSKSPDSKHEFLAAVQQSYEEPGEALVSQPIVSPNSPSTSPTSPSCLVRPSSGNKKPAHKRTVSWGMPAISPPPPTHGGNRMHLPSWDGTTLSGSQNDKKLDLSNVINAGGHTELEAETYILQALEKITVHERTNTEVSGLYSTIVEDELASKWQQSNFETEDDEDEEDDEFDDDGSNPKPKPTPKPRPMMTKQTSFRFKGLIQRERVQDDTVEGTLFDLASALKELDNDTVHRSASQDEAQVPESNFTSADKLANAAQKILDHGKDHPATENPTATGGAGYYDSSHSSYDGDGRKKRKGNRVVQDASNGVKAEWELFNNYFSTKKAGLKKYTRKILWLVLLPSLGLATFLYYIVENPDLCPVKKVNGTVAPTMPPSMAPSYSPSAAPTEFVSDPWLSWAQHDTLQDMNMTLNMTNITMAPNETQAPEEESIFEVFTVCPGLGASASWWFLFMGVRQVITFCMALITQSLIVDYLALQSRVMLNTFGPIFTLLVVQSKGWPFILIFWAIYDLILLCGDADYHHHWGYWQDLIGMFNENNPSGDVVNNEWNQRILVNAIIVGVAVAIKRLVVGLFLGRQTFAHYGEQLASVMKNMVLVGEVATLARYIENTQDEYADHLMFRSSNTSGGWKALVSQSEDETDDDEDPASAAAAANAFIANRESEAKAAERKASDVHSVRSIESIHTMATANEFTESQQMEMAELLDAWEEPETAEEKEEKKITIGAVLQFRQALTFMNKKYTFLPAFGPADTRQACIGSAQQVYERLLLRTPHQKVLPFATLALLAKKEDGSIDKEKAKEIIKVFRPDRDGTLGKLEFVKSVDVIYRALRLLSANISNSSQMDAAVENIINVVFYIVLFAIIIYRLGEDPLALFLSFSSVILAFSFLIGKACSKYVNGCLFILVQRPYGVGDRIHLSNPQNETSPDGSSGWIVEKVALFSTSVFWGATNERATLCNGAICYLRVINAARSPNATVYVQLKFGIDTEYEKIEIFRTAVEQYLKDRPREWLTFVGFRPGEVAPDKGYIGYTVIVQHRNAWQAIGGITESKANLTTYCLEVARQLEMRFLSPPLPVDLTMKENDALAMPLLGEIPSDESASRYPDASPASAHEAASAINSIGLRHRRGKSRFAELVRMAIEANKDK